MTINNSLKIKIINDYLAGMKREEFVNKYDISTGSVSAIAEDFESEIPDIHKIRAMMVKLNTAGNDPKLFYSAVRLHNYIKNVGLTEAKAEHIIEIFQEYAFKKNYNVSALIDSIINAFIIAQKCGTDLEHLESDTNAKKLVKDALEAQIRKLNSDREIMPYKLNVDLVELQEYKKNQPLFQKYNNLLTESDIQDRRLKLLEDDNKELKIQLLEKDREIERLRQLISQQREREGEEYIDYQQDIVNFDSINLPLDDINDVGDNI